MPARTIPCKDVNSFEIIDFTAYAWSIISDSFTVNEQIMGIPIFFLIVNF